MTLYSDDRTKQIVERLVAVGNRIGLVSLAYTIGFGAFIALGGGVIGGPSGALIGAILGLLVGGVFSSAMVALFQAVLEWMAQVLIVQQSILRKLQDSDR